MPYEADIVSEPGSIIDGDMRLKAKVVVVRYETATSQPVKVATRMVRAWTPKGLHSAGEKEARAIMRRDKEKRAEEITRKIERVKVSLIKEKK